MLAPERSVQFNVTVAASGNPDALLGLLGPFWQLVLGAVIVVFVAWAAARLARRGRSRMNTAIMVTGAALLGLVILGALTAR